MAIILLIAGIVLLIGGLFFALKSFKPMYFNVIAGIVILIGTFFGLFGKQLQDKNSSEKSDKILSTSEATVQKISELKSQNSELTKKSDELKEKAEKQSETIDKLREENINLYSKLANINNEIFSNLTGGNSFCRMSIGSINETTNVGNLVFFIEGKNPLSRVQARIYDLNDSDDQILTLQDLSKNIIEIGTLDPERAWSSNFHYKLDKIKGVNLNIFVSANNGFTVQAMRMRFIENTWVRADKIATQIDNKELYIKIDKNYPIKDKKEIFK